MLGYTPRGGGTKKNNKPPRLSFYFLPFQLIGFNNFLHTTVFNLSMFCCCVSPPRLGLSPFSGCFAVAFLPFLSSVFPPPLASAVSLAPPASSGFPFFWPIITHQRQMRHPSPNNGSFPLLTKMISKKSHHFLIQAWCTHPVG